MFLSMTADNHQHDSSPARVSAATTAAASSVSGDSTSSTPNTISFADAVQSSSSGDVPRWPATSTRQRSSDVLFTAGAGMRSLVKCC